jgi:hypothetical protein
MINQFWWVTNISNRNVSLADLNLTVKAYSSANLLDQRHYSYTYEQLEASKNTGSIAKKSDKIKVREVPPEVMKMNIPFSRETYIPNRERSTFEIKNDNYDELNVSDEQFAEENADTADLDTKPLIIKERS